MILFEIEHSHIVWTRDHAVPATETPVLVDNHDAVFAFVGRVDRADHLAGRFITVVAKERHCNRLGILDFSPDGRLPDPMDIDEGIAVKCDIVFFSARCQTSGAILVALTRIDDHSPLLFGRVGGFVSCRRSVDGDQGQSNPNGGSGGQEAADLAEVSPVESFSHFAAVSDTSFFVV